MVSSHFGPWPFAGRAGDAFHVGEDVLVELQGPPGSYRVENVRPARQRQPEGTQTPFLDELNARRLGDCYVEARTADALQLWLGDCCRYCGPSLFVTFRDVTAIHGLSEHGDLDYPHFRLASAAERREHALAVDGAAQAYCIVTNHGDGPDGPSVFVVAGTIELEALPALGSVSPR
mgnify:CR=1 FL=1